MTTPHRSASIDALRRNALTVWPGMTIFWIGDLAHQGTVSGHNPDDYPPLRAELTDSDTDPEVRALDFMIGPRFTVADGWSLVATLTNGSDKQRLYYVIYRSTIWRRATGFKAEPYGGDNHNDHVHVSGHVSDDANGSDWRSVLALGEDESMTIAELHALLLSILTADTPVERQVRDMIMGGIQSPANGRGLLSRVMDGLATPATVDIPALVAALDPALRMIVREELDKTKLGSE